MLSEEEKIPIRKKIDEMINQLPTRYKVVESKLKIFNNEEPSKKKLAYRDYLKAGEEFSKFKKEILKLEDSIEEWKLY